MPQSLAPLFALLVTITGPDGVPRSSILDHVRSAEACERLKAVELRHLATPRPGLDFLAKVECVDESDPVQQWN